MSDRYETPSWSDEPEELGETNPVTTDAPQPVPDDAGLDASSENVFAGWPVAEPGPSKSGDAEEEAEPPAAPTRRTDPSRPSSASWKRRASEESEEEAEEEVVAAPLADHVSASGEHAPGDLTVPPGYSILEGDPDGRAARGRHRRRPVQRQRHHPTCSIGARRARGSCGVSTESITVMPVPGAFELPLAAMALAKTRRFACIVALGCVIRGERPFRLVPAKPRAAPARRHRDRRARCVRGPRSSTHRAGREPLGQGRRGGANGARDGRRVRETLRAAAAQVAGYLPLHSAAAMSKICSICGKSPASATTGATRWSPPSAASTRTCNASA